MEEAIRRVNVFYSPGTLTGNDCPRRQLGKLLSSLVTNEIFNGKPDLVSVCLVLTLFLSPHLLLET